MKELRLTALAHIDLTDIEKRSREAWGEAQAAAYRQAIGQRLHRISSRPAVGVNCGHVLAGLRRMSTGSHIIFYVEHEDFVLVVRVLHQRTDYRAHLQGLPGADT